MHSNLLLVANYASDYGYAWWLMENFWVQLAQHVVGQGNRAFLIYPRITRLSETIKAAEIETAELPFRFSTPQQRHKLKAFIQANGIGAVYLTDQAYLSVSYALLRRWGVKRILIHDHAPGERDIPGPLKKLLKKAVHQLQLFSADHYIGVSRFVYNRFLQVGCIPEKKCSFVLNGIRPYENKQEIQGYARKQFDLPDDAIIAVSTGRATIYKGIDFLIECADELVHQQREDRLYFIHCGDGVDLDYFKKLVAQKHLEKRFILAGRRSDIQDILLTSDIAVHASSGEAFSLSILEYMSAGLACVVPDNCGNSEAITDGTDGILYQTRDREGLVTVLRGLLDNEMLRKDLGRRARQTVEQRFTIERANRDLLQVVSAVM